MSDTEWTDEEWQLDQAVMDAEEIRPSGQVARLRAIREEWPKLHATVAALTAENERLTRAQRDHFTLREELRIACETGMRLNLPAEQIVARVRDSLGADAARFAIRDRESRAALPSTRETTDG